MIVSDFFFNAVLLETDLQKGCAYMRAQRVVVNGLTKWALRQIRTAWDMATIRHHSVRHHSVGVLPFQVLVDTLIKCACHGSWLPANVQVVFPRLCTSNSSIILLVVGHGNARAVCALS